jgi:hypothetical protein
MISIFITTPLGFWQTVISLMDRVPKAILLSGTPSPTRPLDLHPQASALRPNVFAKDRVKFADDYCKKRKTRLVQGGVCRRPHELHLLLTRSIMIRLDSPHLLNRRAYIFPSSMSRSYTMTEIFQAAEEGGTIRASSQEKNPNFSRNSSKQSPLDFFQ